MQHKDTVAKRPEANENQTETYENQTGMQAGR